MAKGSKKKKKIDINQDADAGFGHNPFAAALGLSAPEAPAAAPSTDQDSSNDSARWLETKKLTVRKERKGRGGKTVTVVSGFGEECAGELDDVASQLARALGCGASREAQTIAIQGDQRDRAKAWLEKQGIRKVTRG